jgi:hypothetical protein
MTNRLLAMATPSALRVSLIACALAGATSSASASSALINEVLATPQGQWSLINGNSFSSIWPNEAIIPRYLGNAGSPYSVISAWSSFVWDPVRSDLLLFGGGNRNYSGNEVYKFNGGTLRWELASLPSAAPVGTGQPTPTAGLNNPAELFTPYIPIGGANTAPQSAHTYDNTVWLPNAQRYLVLGGAATGGNGETFMKDNGNGTYSLTGPYLFDPTKADGTRVGGVDCSNVTSTGAPCALGGNMWQNRDAGFTAGRGFLAGTSDVVSRDGKDVVYFTTTPSFGSSPDLFEYIISDVNNPGADSWRKVGHLSSSFDPSSPYYISHAGEGAGAYDPIRNIYIRTGFNNSNAFEFWSLNSAGATNPVRKANITLPLGFVMSTNYGLDYDAVNDQFLLWDGHLQVWSLKIPSDPTQPWTLTQDNAIDTNAYPNATYVDGNGILGKWHFAPELGVFIGLENAAEGNVWVYKPSDWVSPFADNGVPVPAGLSLFLLGLSALAIRRYRR